jgi:aspartate/glutamate racemase
LLGGLILDATAKESARIRASEVLILGTALTMRSPKFREGFAKYGVEATGPHDEGARVMTAGLITELQLGKAEGAAERLGRIARNVVWTAVQGHSLWCV